MSRLGEKYEEMGDLRRLVVVVASMVALFGLLCTLALLLKPNPRALLFALGAWLLSAALWAWAYSEFPALLEWVRNWLAERAMGRVGVELSSAAPIPGSELSVSVTTAHPLQALELELRCEEVIRTRVVKTVSGSSPTNPYALTRQRTYAAVERSTLYSESTRQEQTGEIPSRGSISVPSWLPPSATPEFGTRIVYTLRVTAWPRRGRKWSRSHPVLVRAPVG